MQNTFSQSGNDSKWFSKKSFFRIGMWKSRPPPLHGKKHLKFPFWLFDYPPYSASTRLGYCLLQVQALLDVQHCWDSDFSHSNIWSKLQRTLEFSNYLVQVHIKFGFCVPSCQIFETAFTRIFLIFKICTLLHPK